MSRFHFDENAASAVSTSLSGIVVNINTCKEQLNSVLNDLQYYEGFNIGYAFEQIETEKRNNMQTCINNVLKSQSVILNVAERVHTYSQLASMAKASNSFVQSISNKTLGTEFDAYNRNIADFAVSKNNAFTGIVLALDFGDLIVDTISGFKKNGKLDGVDRKNCKNSLIAVLNSLAQNDSYPGEEVWDGMNDSLKGALKELKMAKTLTPDLIKEMPKEIQDFFKDIGKFADVQKLGGELVANWFEDYSQSMKYLDTLTLLANNGEYDQMTMDVINELKAEYSNKFFQSINTIVDFGIDKASGKVVDIILDILPGFKSIYTILDFTAGLTAEFTGYDDVASSYHTFSGLVTLESQVNAEYKAISQEILNGNLSQETIGNYRNLFELKRSLKISELNAMIAMEEAERDSATNPIMHPDMLTDMLIPDRNRSNETAETYNKKIAAYQAIIEEINNLECPV